MPGGYASSKTYIVLKFATYSENGLIYFRGNEVSSCFLLLLQTPIIMLHNFLQIQANSDFVSIEMEEGRLKVQINLGGDSRMRLYTNDSYNDGKKYAISIERLHKNGWFIYAYSEFKLIKYCSNICVFHLSLTQKSSNFQNLFY